jgi:hypothetical protein
MSDRKWRHGEIGSVNVAMSDDEIAAASKLVGQGVPPQEAMETALSSRTCRCLEFLTTHVCQGLEDE